jgi:hypothetical protein
MPPAWFEPRTPANEWPQGQSLERAATGIGSQKLEEENEIENDRVGPTLQDSGDYLTSPKQWMKLSEDDNDD